ncbi:MAG TPA: flavoprotein, partial [Thermoanaerobaculia bacterium]|nr:flavoprotein [Thermoanaerobaculia bacterium]
MTRPHIAILGAGPIGLEAALAAAEHGFSFTLYEAGARPAEDVRAWGHVRMFTPWEMNLSDRMRRGLAGAGQPLPAADRCPTGRELLAELMEPLAALPAIAPRLRLDTRVQAVGREGLLKNEEIATPARAARRFRLLLTDPAGREWTESADVVLDATGTSGHPNSLGDGGIPAPGETAASARITRRIPDLEREAASWAGRTVLLAGAGHSAQTAGLALADLAREATGTRVVWALRKDELAGGGEPDPLPERARLVSRARELAAGASPAVEVRRRVVVESLRPANGGLSVTLRAADGERREVAADRVLSLTGGVGDHALYRQLQVHECY